MKIYCSRQPDDEFAKFIGKDLWVRVYSKDYGAEFYVNLREVNDHVYEDLPDLLILTFSEVPAKIIDAAYKDRLTIQDENNIEYSQNYWAPDHTVSRGYNHFKEVTSIVQPEEILNTEELMAIIKRAYERVV